MVWKPGMSGMLVLCLAAAPLQLMKKLPPTSDPVRLSGESFLCRPAADSRGTVFLFWRCITSHNDGLVTSVFFQKLNPAGKPRFVGGPRVPYQGRFSLIDHNSNPADGEAAVIADEQGGVFYHYGPWVMHFGADGKRSWPVGKHRGGNRPLRRYPSPVRITRDVKANIGKIYVWPDGRGGSMASWYFSGGVRAQRIDRRGRLLWGQQGLPLYFKKDDLDRTHGRVVPDGRGGLVAFLMSNTYGEDKKPRVVYYNADGRRTGVSRSFNFGFSLVNDAVYRTASDWAGGIYILYAKYTKSGAPISGYQTVRYHQVFLCRMDRSGRMVFHKKLSGRKDIVPGKLALRADRKGNVLASWHHIVLAADPDDDDDKVAIVIARYNRSGISHWRQNAVIQFKSTIGKNDYKTYNGNRDMLVSGNRVFFVHDSMTENKSATSGYANSVFLHTIDSAGKLVYSGTGKKMAVSGYYPCLLNVKHKPALVFYRSMTISGIQGTVVPWFEFLK